MKKLSYIVLFVFLSFNTLSFSQIVVDNNGDVGIKINSQILDSDLSIRSTGDTDVCTYIEANRDDCNVGIRVNKTGPATTSHDYNMGIYTTVNALANSSKKQRGIMSNATRPSNSNNGRAYGIAGIAGKATPGWNFGVSGMLSGSNNGTGIYGSSTWDDGISIDDKYAGFFHGDVKVTDVVYASSFNTLSDYRLKENIESIEDGSLTQLLKMNVVKYNIKQIPVELGDTAIVSTDYYLNESNVLDKKHFGLIAQELQLLYPDLVTESNNGFLSVNYVEIIPLLIKSIQELTLKLDYLSQKAAMSQSRDNLASITNIDDENECILYQNNPNPFTDNTIINCTLNEEAKQAILYIYDINGHQIDNISIVERGNVKIVLEGHRFVPGIYLYSLVVDNCIIDTKRMIITK